MLESLNLRNNSLSGRLPAGLEQLAVLQQLDLAANQLQRGQGLPEWLAVDRCAARGWLRQCGLWTALTRASLLLVLLEARVPAPARAQRVTAHGCLLLLSSAASLPAAAAVPAPLAIAQLAAWLGRRPLRQQRAAVPPADAQQQPRLCCAAGPWGVWLHRLLLSAAVCGGGQRQRAQRQHELPGAAAAAGAWEAEEARMPCCAVRRRGRMNARPPCWWCSLCQATATAAVCCAGDKWRGSGQDPGPAAGGAAAAARRAAAGRCGVALRPAAPPHGAPERRRRQEGAASGCRSTRDVPPPSRRIAVHAALHPCSLQQSVDTIHAASPRPCRCRLEHLPRR